MDNYIDRMMDFYDEHRELVVTGLIIVFFISLVNSCMVNSCTSHSSSTEISIHTESDKVKTSSRNADTKIKISKVVKEPEIQVEQEELTLKIKQKVKLNDTDNFDVETQIWAYNKEGYAEGIGYTESVECNSDEIKQCKAKEIAKAKVALIKLQGAM